ncbi:bile acid:sodium symporter family protein [Roseococcus pinisoli]|uniref:Bile acid:sodium symporter n=1 Tax=Roseococcus pinisoli TaxID=2835040 RepID=A0ABS5Q892_9PROT|nr:bile acid:sodium symporter family protein [Roseococcus pinisoli]MBS7809618.1 bile acid:sodium symporter [Roseococcus pinisoli]
MRFKLPIDGFVLALLSTVALASVLPAQGRGAEVMGQAANVAIAFLFFLYGLRLAPRAALQGLAQWRLHLAVIAATFVVFPLLGLATGLLPESVLPPGLYAGILFLCVLPSTVQSSIAFTSIAGGNVAAAICSASASNLLGILLTPALVALLMHGAGAGISLGVLGDIAMQLFLPFALGQLLRPRLGAWAERHRWLLGRMDRLSILMVVYVAFSEGVVSGIWHRLDAAQLGVLLVICLALLGAVLGVTVLMARLLGLGRVDEIVLVFCGSKKSLASGLPMASVIFAGSQVGLIVLPLMLFHQVQLMVCAWLARRYAEGSRETVALPAE